MTIKPTSKAGRELDCLVAETVLKFKPMDPPSDLMDEAFKKNYWEDYKYYRLTPDNWTLPGIPYEIHRYSEGMLASWDVVATMVKDGFTFSLDNVSLKWIASFAPVSYGQHPTDGETVQVAETAPEAICLAAIAAIQKYR